MTDVERGDLELLDELEALRRRLMELEEMEVMRVTEEQERFDSLQVLDEYAKQLEESRDKLARLLRAGAEVQEASTVKEALEKIAGAVGEAGWGSVSVVLLENWEVVQSAYYGCSAEDVEFLETHRRPPEERARFFGPACERFKISRSYFVPADCLPQVVQADYVVPGRRSPQPGDTWDPMDLAYVPLYGSGGTIIGSINCDDPVDGRRPTSETFFYLELFADFAARKVETAKLLEQQRRTEDALRLSEIKYRTVFSRSEDGFLIISGGRFRECNEKACELWSCTTEDLLGHTPAEFSPEYQPDGRRSADAATDFMQRAMRGEPQCFYWVHRRLDGTLLDCDVSLSAVEMDHETVLLGIVRDVSERRRAEFERETVLRVVQAANAAQTQEEMVASVFAEIARLMPVENYYLALYDARTDMVSFPHFFDERDAAPAPRPAARGLTEWIIHHGESLLLSPSDFQGMIDTGEVDLHGTPMLSWLGVPLTTASRTIGALVVQSYRREGLYSANDQRILHAIASQIATVVERMRTEEWLRFSQVTVDRGPEPVYWIDASGQIAYANEAAGLSLGYTPDELLSRTVFDLDPQIERAAWPAVWEELKRDQSTAWVTSQRSRDGVTRRVGVTANYVESNGRGMVCAYVRGARRRARTAE